MHPHKKFKTRKCPKSRLKNNKKKKKPSSRTTPVASSIQEYRPTCYIRLIEHLHLQLNKSTRKCHKYTTTSKNG